MAENKKAFVLYKDQRTHFTKLTDEMAGKLIKHIFSYISDEDPEPIDIVIDLSFEPIKLALKRDLIKYEKRADTNKTNGLLGGRPKKQKEPKEPNGLNGNRSKAKKGDSVSDSDSDSEIIDKSITYTEKLFLSDWNELRFKHLKKKTDIKMLVGDDRDNFKELSKQYNNEDFRNSIIGLFKQKKLPHDNEVMQANPKHLLNYFNTYLSAYHDKNDSLYGKKEIHKL